MRTKDQNQTAHYDAAVKIVNTLHKAGHEAYFAGGWVRDFVMSCDNNKSGDNNENKNDIDIATSAPPSEVKKIFKRAIGVGEQFGVMIVVVRDFQFEVATFRADVGVKDGRHPESVVFTDALNDAMRRDFSINGMFYDPVQNKVIDYVGGKEAIANRVVSAIGNAADRFKEDYLRMLRAVRFTARFDFSLDKDTKLAIIENAHHITKISAERIFAELSKMLTGPNPAISIELLRETNLLEHILPEVRKMIGVEQPPQFHPEGDVYTHTVEMLKLLPPQPSAQLAWSALLHDVGKPKTMTVTDRIRFNNHDHVGAVIAEKILTRLRAPNALTDAVVAMIDNHMNFMNVDKMRMSTLKKFLSRETILDELELHRIDCLSSHGELDNFYFIKEKLETFEPDEIKPDPLLKGRDLIKLGMTPGPIFGEILGAVYDMQLENKITTTEEAIEIVRTQYL